MQLSSKEKAVEDGLFLERLETLFAKSLSDIRAFAEREARPLEEVRRYIAQWHSAYLFEPSLTPNGGVQERVNNVLRYTSQTLEALHDIAGLQSFFLVVNPCDPADEGFLGGTVLGREFWRGHRGCGVAGARAFQVQSMKAKEENAHNPMARVLLDQPAMVNIPPQKKGPASSLKAEVYNGVRNAIRATSGIRNAEMKWKDHSKLDLYGVRLEGWPSDVPQQNPSSLSVTQNRQVLDALNSGSMKFVRIASGSGATVATQPRKRRRTLESPELSEESVDFSWACRDPDEVNGPLQPSLLSPSARSPVDATKSSLTAVIESSSKSSPHSISPDSYSDEQISNSPSQGRR